MATIERLYIAGFRSIDQPVEVRFPRNTPVVLIGENNAGKSNVVRAIETILGELWPGTREPEDHDHFGRSTEKRIQISVKFTDDDPLNGEIRSLKWECDRASPGEDVTFKAKSLGGNEFRPNKIQREDLLCVVVGADRNLQHQMSYRSKVSVHGRRRPV